MKTMGYRLLPTCAALALAVSFGRPSSVHAQDWRVVGGSSAPDDQTWAIDLAIRDGRVLIAGSRGVWHIEDGNVHQDWTSPATVTRLEALGDLMYAVGSNRLVAVLQAGGWRVLHIDPDPSSSEGVLYGVLRVDHEVFAVGRQTGHIDLAGGRVDWLDASVDSAPIVAWRAGSSALARALCAEAESVQLGLSEQSEFVVCRGGAHLVLDGVVQDVALPPVRSGIVRAAFDRTSGTLLVVSRGRAYRWSRGERWRRITLPHGMRASSAVSAAGRLYVAGGDRIVVTSL